MAASFLWAQCPQRALAKHPNGIHGCMVSGASQAARQSRPARHRFFRGRDDARGSKTWLFRRLRFQRRRALRDRSVFYGKKLARSSRSRCARFWMRKSRRNEVEEEGWRDEQRHSRVVGFVFTISNYYSGW